MYSMFVYVDMHMYMCVNECMHVCVCAYLCVGCCGQCTCHSGCVEVGGGHLLPCL